MRALVVDDSNFTRRVLVKLLQEVGVSTPEEAVNGVEAIRLLNANTYDLVTIDLVMPGSHGTDVVRHIKQRSPQTIIVICSSVSEREVVLELVKLGVDEFVLKPFSEEKLKRVLERSVNKINSLN